MNIFFILRVSSVFFLGNFASCTRTGESKNSHSPTLPNEINNQTSIEVEKPVASKTKTVILKPCDRQKKRVASFIFPPNFRPFIPLCDSNGYYLPLQCHPSNGYCWCVDKNGNMKHGTRTKGVIDCGWRAIMKKPCERHRLRSLKHKSRSHRSVFVPRCGKDGYYSPMQCSAGNKYCWCVDKHGHKKRETRTKGIIDCSKPKEKEKASSKNPDDVYSAHDGADGPCSRHKRRRNSLKSDVKRKYFNPNCDEDGFYAKKQCHAGLCWCSHRNGNFIAGSKKEGDVDCESPRSASGPTRPLKSRCYTERLRGLKSSLMKMQFVPLCTLEGSYAPVQCDTQQGYCWCSDKWGNEIKNSKTKRTPKCLTNGFTSHKKKPCYELKTYIKQLPSIGKIYIPVCKRTGYYRSLQCSRDKKYCWCVEQDGTELKGTVTFGKPECPERSINMSHMEVMKVKNGPCTRQKEQRKKLILVVRRNLFNPRCNEFGFYDVKQCHGKYCWCTDKNGKMIRGTKAIGNVDCAKFAGPHDKPCLANRLKALRISLIKKPYVPQCESGGDYMPLQCNVYTGECWCVGKGGKEIPGSRTRRTPNCFAKAFNSVQDGPCHILKAYVSKLPPNTMVNDPICEGSGFFQPSQCGNSNGFCWCVMPDGTEVQGSLTFGKPNCHEKRSPAVPRLRGPCDEHVAHVNNMLRGERKNVYTPVCDDEGYYASHQCNNDTTWCWCVNKYGSLIEGTRMQGKLINCDEKILKPCYEFNKKNEEVNQGVNFDYNAVCTEKGYFAPLQCNVNSGKCWCVNNMGSALPGTAIYQRPYCGKEQRKCEIERRNSLSKNNPTTAPASCDVYGYYSRLQCDHLTDECWCSDIYGKETVGTRVNGIAICGQLSRPCEEHASTASNYDNLFGVFIPQCDSQGYYAKIQCHEKTSICWCSNKVGVEIPGTKTNGQPNCFF